jgi:Ca-activated chloride channel family protein
VLPAKDAKAIYQSIVQKTLDPGLLEYMGHNMLRLRVYPIAPNSDQKISFTYNSVAPKDSGMVHYTYPLKADGKAVQTLEKYSVTLNLKSQHALGNIYSPSHPVTITRPNDKNATVVFEKNEALLDRDFQLYYSAGGKDVEITALAHRPEPGQKGHFMLLVAPRAELSKEQQVPRDVIFVLDTSGSMRGKRLEQAQKALTYCLNNLNPQDRFALIHFATGVTKYSQKWLEASKANLGPATKWVNDLEATGGTAINAAMQTALAMRSDDPGRTFTIVFLTDGRPTVGEINPDNILKNTMAKNTANTRIFTFGVGDDVNASLLDQLADQTKGYSSFVREHEDIEVYASALFNKISHPVLTDLQLTWGDNVKITEVYPPQLPDLFHGSQLVILGRYEGDGHAAIKLTGKVGMKTKELVYEVNFPQKTAEPKAFVEDLWARRKVGYLLDQIRLNGEQKELVDEVITLAKRYGITTPYTSYLIVPDEVITAVKADKAKGGKSTGKPDVSFHLIPGVNGSGFGPTAPPALKPGFGGIKAKTGAPATAPIPVSEFIKEVQAKPGDAAELREKLANETFNNKDFDGKSEEGKALKKFQEQYQSYAQAHKDLKKGDKGATQSGTVGVNLSIASNQLRQMNQVNKTAVARVANTNCLDVGGVWIDEAYHAKLKTVNVKAMSNAYFRMLEKHPEVKQVFTLGNHLVWVTPSGTALVLDTTAGREEMPDAEIDALFVAKK